MNSAHRREGELKFCNISKVDAKVSFFLQENNPDIFIMEPEELYIQVLFFYILFCNVYNVFNFL